VGYFEDSDEVLVSIKCSGIS